MSVSIIITALNEQYTERTVLDILSKSGDELREIIVIDDCSDDPINFDAPKIQIYRNATREGLIRGRNKACEIATSDIIISVDPHVKVSDGWLLPIIDRISDNYRCIAVPVTRTLNPKTWVENNYSQCKTGWHWNLDFYWIRDDGTDETPCFAGHCFAFSKRWWEESGKLDDGMDKWGGENIEFSLRTWLCGGSVEVVRDCWVAHWFKEKFDNYSFDTKTLLHNKARVAEVWFDEHKKLFYDAVGKPPGDIDFGDIGGRVAIRTHLQKLPFSWFLDKFQPELGDIYALKDAHVGETFVIVGASPCMDDINISLLGAFDNIIGINYIAAKIMCKYALFHDGGPVMVVADRNIYSNSQLLVPVGKCPGLMCTRYMLGRQDSSGPLKTKNPPFFWHATSAHTAAHVAAFMGARSVTLVGCDGKLAPDGRSHTSIIPHYRGGYYWSKDIVTDHFLERIERGYDDLRVAFRRWKIPLMRVGYL